MHHTSTEITMPNTTVPAAGGAMPAASQERAPTRRAILAAAPALAAVSSLAAVVAVPAAAAPFPMAEAVARHRAAWTHFEANVWRTDELDPRFTVSALYAPFWLAISLISAV
jgi:hypothetical protein